MNTSNTSKKSSNFLVLNKDTEDSSKEENIGTDGTGTTHSEHTIVEEEAEPNLALRSISNTKKMPDPELPYHGT